MSRGGRPSLSDGCDKNKFVKWPDELKMLIQQCWYQKSSRRPTFDIFKQQWGVQFREERVRSMIEDESARPWFCNSEYITEAKARKQRIELSAAASSSSTKKRLSEMSCGELHNFIKDRAEQTNHRGLSSLSELILKEGV